MSEPRRRNDPPPAPDPVVSLVVWSGPASALAARLGITATEALAAVRRLGSRRGGGWRLEVQSPHAWATARRLLLRRPAAADAD